MSKIKNWIKEWLGISDIIYVVNSNYDDILDLQDEVEHLVMKDFEKNCKVIKVGNKTKKKNDKKNKNK